MGQGHSISYKIGAQYFLQDCICAQRRLREAKDPKRLQADSEDSDQTARMRQAVLSLRWAQMQTCRIWCGPAHKMSNFRMLTFAAPHVVPSTAGSDRVYRH